MYSTGLTECTRMHGPFTRASPERHAMNAMMPPASQVKERHQNYVKSIFQCSGTVEQLMKNGDTQHNKKEQMPLHHIKGGQEEWSCLSIPMDRLMLVAQSGLAHLGRVTLYSMFYNDTTRRTWKRGMENGSKVDIHSRSCIS